MYINCFAPVQFSEHKICRSPCDWYMGDRITDSLKSKSCSNFEVDTQVVSSDLPGRQGTLFNRTCESLQGKPYLFAWQGGAQLATNVTLIKAKVEAAFGTAKAWFKDCPESLHLVHFGVTVCIEGLERRHPYQHRDLIQKNNKELAAWLKDKYPEAISLDPYSATLDAMSDAVAPRSGDGFHFLSDFNVFYANTMLNLMHAITK